MTSVLTRSDIWVLLILAMAVLGLLCVLACMPAASRPRPPMPDTDEELDALMAAACERERRRDRES